MKKILLIFLVFMCSLTQYLYAQGWQPVSVPTPIRYYPLNNRLTDLAHNMNGTATGTFLPRTDRFGQGSGAIQIPDYRSRIQTPGFFDGYNVSNGYTISFWTYIDQNISKNQGNAPWAPTDFPSQAFYAQSDQNSGNNSILGFTRTRDRAIINRYIADGNTLKNWDVWFWDPVNFTNRIGWYHVVISYHQAQVYLYMFYPDGQMASGLYYFRLQDLSKARNWGLGSYTGESINNIDDFKVFNTALDREQVIALHGREAVPSGNMYKISPFNDAKVSIGTVGQSRIQGSKIELYNAYENNSSTYNWIFDPVPGKTNTYKIRMSYEDDRYIAILGTGQEGNGIALLPYNMNYNSTFEWYVMPVDPTNNDQFSFYIQQASNRQMYLHPNRNSTEGGTPLEIWSMIQPNEKSYRWVLNQMKSKYEMSEYSLFPLISDNIIVPVNNTALPLQRNKVRDDYYTLNVKSKVSHNIETWRFEKSTDGSYYIKNDNTSNVYMHLEGERWTSGTAIESYKFNLDTYYQPFYRWTIEQATPFSKNYFIKPVLNSFQSISSGQPTVDENIPILESSIAHNAKAIQWNIFPKDKRLNQLYFIEPGIYKIRSALDPTKYITTRNFESTYGAPLVINDFDERRFTSYYWKVDYERDSSGNPKQDGTYLITLLGTDAAYIHTSGSSFTEFTPVDLWKMEEENFAAYKWYITPATRNNEFNIQVAGDNSMNLHITRDNTSSNTSLDLSRNYTSGASSWNFEKVPNDFLNISGTYYIRFYQDQAKLIHPSGGNYLNGTMLDLYRLGIETNRNFEWLIEYQGDLSYVIKKVGELGLLIHPVGNSTENGTILELYNYFPEYARTYKWLIEYNSDGSYIFKNLDNPDRWIHTSGGSSSDGTSIELYRYRDGDESKNVYKWILTR